MKRKVKISNYSRKSILKTPIIVAAIIGFSLFLFIYSLITTGVNAAFSTITYRGSTSATTGSGSSVMTFTKPAGVIAGDVMLIHIVAKGAAANIYTSPLGWKLIRRDNTSSLIGDAIYYKVATESEPNSYSFTFSSSQQASGGIVAYSEVDIANPISNHSGSVNLNAGSLLTAKSVVASTSNDMLLFFGAVTSKTTIAPPTNMTQRWHSTGSTSTTSEMAEELLTVQGSSGNRVGTSGSTSSSNIGQLVALRPASVGVTLPTPVATPTPTVVPTPIPTVIPVETPIPTVIPDPTPISQSDVTVVAVGDLHCSKGNCTGVRVNDMVSQINPTAFLPIGDLVESGSYSNFINYYHPTWNPFNIITYPTIGNHEGSGAGYYDYWNGVGGSTGRAGERNKGWYSYNLGNWHIVALNSNCVSDSNRVPCQLGSEQIDWLKADLANSTAKCTLTYMHHPYYSTGTRKYPELKTIFQTLYENKVELYLAGHTHYYQRFHPQDADSNRDDVNGVTEIVVGTGGGALANVQSTTKYKNAAKQIGKSHGILKLELKGDSLDYQFVPAPGYTQTDSGSIICR